MRDKVIEVFNLRKVYGDVKALDDVSFEVYRGEIFSYLGPNGSGKTTTVEILVGLRRATSGKARVLGLEVEKEEMELKKRVGVLPQDFMAFERLTVEENIRLFCDLYDVGPSPDELIELIGLSDKKGAKFMELSGGLKQRVGIAAALAGDPEIIFLDEPTTGLDPRSRRETWEVIKSLKRKGKTVFLTTHYMEEAEHLSDRTAIIVKGKIVAIGSPAKLVKEHGGHYKLIVKGLGKDEVKGLSAKVEKDRLILEGEVSQLMSTAQELLKRKGAEVELIKPTLEEVFLRLVGYKITEEGELM